MFVSGEDVAKDREALRTNGVTHIVNASNINLPNYFESDPSLDYLSLKLFDDKSQEISWFFLQVVAYIDACRRAGGKVRASERAGGREGDAQRRGCAPGQCPWLGWAGLGGAAEEGMRVCPMSLVDTSGRASEAQRRVCASVQCG
jgi:hypothetical protein